MIRAALVSWEGWVTPSEADAEVVAVQRGDRDAFASLVARYQNRLYRYLLRWTREPLAAEGEVVPPPPVLDEIDARGRGGRPEPCD